MAKISEMGYSHTFAERRRKKIYSRRGKGCENNILIWGRSINDHKTQPAEEKYFSIGFLYPPHERAIPGKQVGQKNYTKNSFSAAAVGHARRRMNF